jgi:hypothetical protein
VNMVIENLGYMKRWEILKSLHNSWLLEKGSGPSSKFDWITNSGRHRQE